MKRLAIGVAIAAALALLAGVGFVFSGVYNVAATDPHWGVVYQIAEAVRVNSIRAHAKGIQVPADLAKESMVIAGTDHFAAHCAVCHGAPGVPKSDIAKGLYPAPPDLAHAAAHYKPAELFWIVKNGIKMTGMPSWKDHADEELWSTVAFMQRLPGMSEEDYGKLIMATMSGTGHQHGERGMSESEKRTE